MSKVSAVIVAVSVTIALSGAGYGVYASKRSEARIAALEARLAKAEEKVSENEKMISMNASTLLSHNASIVALTGERMKEKMAQLTKDKERLRKRGSGLRAKNQHEGEMSQEKKN